MALNPIDVANFETLKKAFCKGDVALMECTDVTTKEYRAVICMVNRGKDGYMNLVPMGHMPIGNPFELYTDPTA